MTTTASPDESPVNHDDADDADDDDEETLFRFINGNTIRKILKQGD